MTAQAIKLIPTTCNIEHGNDEEELSLSNSHLPIYLSTGGQPALTTCDVVSAVTFVESETR